MNRRSRRLMWMVATLAVLLGGLVLWTWPALRRVLELSDDGGVMRLREELRPIRGTTRVLILALDGVGDADLRQAVTDGHLSSLARLAGRALDDDRYEHAYAVPGVLSILPSITMAAWTSVFTGRPPGETGVPGNEWYVRDERRLYAPAPVSLEEYAHTLAIYTDRLLDARIAVPTLFERLDLRTHVSLLPIARGADLLVVPSVRNVGELFGRLAAGVGDEAPADREPYAALDSGAIDALLEMTDEHGLPDVQVAYFPGLDLYTHLAEAPLAQLQQYLHDIVDPALQRLLDRYAAHGALDATYVLVVSDHGHTPVLMDDRHALATDPDTDPPAVLTRAGYRVRPFVLEPADDEQDYQAVLAYQGAFAMVYVADRSTCPARGDRCDWQAPPRWDEDIVPVARAFARASGEGVPVAEMRDTIDLIFVREGRAPGEAPLPFQVWDGAGAVPIDEYLRRVPRPDLLRLAERLDALATGPAGRNAGDVLLLARSGMNRPIEERFYFSNRNRSWHGSPEAQDSRVPILVAHPRRSGAQLAAHVQSIVGAAPSQLDVVPIVESLLLDATPE